MGKWNNRSRFQRRRSPMRWYTEQHSSSSGHYRDEGEIPRWEKRFCEEIGSVPWPKVVEASNFKSWYQGNVMTWNDSACEETFNNEKRRFWSQVNGLHCDIPLPDPDLYISEVDWDTTIDPELIRDLEKAYFAPPDDNVNSGFKRGRRDKYWSGCNLEPVEETGLVNVDKVDDGKKSNPWKLSESSTDRMKDSGRPWEGKRGFGNDATSGDCLTTEEGREFQWKNNENLRQGNDGWDYSGHRDKKAKGSESVLAEEYDNPWEAKPVCRKEIANDTAWRDWSGKEGWDNEGWGSGGWDLRHQGRERKEWRDKRYSQDFQEPKGCNSWKGGYGHDNAAFRGYGGNAGGWQTHRASENNRRNWDVKQSNDGWGRRNRESDDSYTRYNSNYRNSRPRRDDYLNRKVNY